MIKLFDFIKRNPSVDMDFFKDYYENSHAKMIRHAQGLVLDYRRNYAIPIPGMEPPLYDCVTECWIKDLPSLQRLFELMSVPELKAEIEADEEKIFHRPSMKMMVGEEFVSKL